MISNSKRVNEVRRLAPEDEGQAPDFMAIESVICLGVCQSVIITHHILTQYQQPGDVSTYCYVLRWTLQHHSTENKTHVNSNSCSSHCIRCIIQLRMKLNASISENHSAICTTPERCKDCYPLCSLGALVSSFSCLVFHTRIRAFFQPTYTAIADKIPSKPMTEIFIKKFKTKQCVILLIPLSNAFHWQDLFKHNRQADD
jgi:hypothetical protein